MQFFAILWKVFPRKMFLICTRNLHDNFFFWNHPYSPSKVKWSAPKFGLFILSETENEIQSREQRIQRRVVHVMSLHKSYRNKLFCRKINHNDNKWADLRRNWVCKWSRLFAQWSTCHTLIVRLHRVLTF